MKKNRLILLIGIICLVILFSTAIGIGISKYVHSDDDLTQINSDDFILVSNYQNNSTYEIYRKDITISVSNNDLSGITSKDIKFNVTLTNNQNSNIVVRDNITLTGNVIDNESITFDSLVVGTIYTVTISSVSPVKKTITHEFIIKEDPTTLNYYSLTDCGGWIELDIYVGSNDITNLRINYPASLAADNTNELTNDWYGVIGNLTNLSNNSHYHLIFFKNDSSTFSNIVKSKIDNTNSITIVSD